MKKFLAYLCYEKIGQTKKIEKIKKLCLSGMELSERNFFLFSLPETATMKKRLITTGSFLSACCGGP